MYGLSWGYVGLPILRENAAAITFMSDILYVPERDGAKKKLLFLLCRSSWTLLKVTVLNSPLNPALYENRFPALEENMRYAAGTSSV